MKNSIKKNIITLLILLTTAVSVNAESLFTLGASQTFAPTPKSLYGGVQARSVGDLISILMVESISMTDDIAYTSAKKSTTVDNFSNFLNSFFNHDVINSNLNNFGGSNTVDNSAGTSRKMTFGDIISVQVVQQMPNGNLVVQGKKTIVNSNERMDLLVTGVVDPRSINALGQVSSNRVANLQFAQSGRGSVSRSGNEGIINKFIKYLF